MKRQIIKIDENKCNGCGKCIPGCPEGALQIIDGKARLVSDLFCDGLGACIGTCPQGAILVEEREAEPYDERKVMRNIIKGGKNVIKAHLKHLKDHNETQYLKQAVDILNEKGIDVPSMAEDKKIAGGCPGMKSIDLRQDKKADSITDQQVTERKSELNQWPIQLRLLNPNAPYFDNADLLITADCVPFTYNNFHEKFLRNKILIMFCPKLDDNLDNYVDKLAQIFSLHQIKSITLVHMEVPCCSGVNNVVNKALIQADEKIELKDFTISLKGKIL